MVSTVQVRVVAGPVLPAASVWCTWKVWAPWARAEYPFGVVQAAKLPLSSLHSNEPPDSPVKAKLAAALLTEPFGPLVSVGADGGVRSIVQVHVSEALPLLTVNVCWPSARPE